MCLISDVIQHFVDQKVAFDSSYVYDDVKRSIEFVHKSGLLHRKILAEPAKYLVKSVRSSDLKTPLELFKDCACVFIEIITLKMYFLTNTLLHSISHWCKLCAMKVNNKPSSQSSLMWSMEQAC